MLYQRDLKAKWNEYANLTTAKNEGVKAGIEKGRMEGKADVVKNLLVKMNLSDEPGCRNSRSSGRLRKKGEENTELTHSTSIKRFEGLHIGSLFNFPAM